MTVEEIIKSLNKYDNESTKNYLISSLRLDNYRDEKDYDYEEICKILEDISASLDTDILNGRKNIILSGSLINNTRSDIINILSFRDTVDPDNKETLEQYDKLISEMFGAIEVSLKYIEDSNTEIDAIKAAKDYINKLKTEI